MRIQHIIKNVQVLFSVWFRIKRIIKNVQGIIQCKLQYSAYYSYCPGYYSGSCSGFSVLLKNVVYFSESGSGLNVLLKMSRVLFSVWLMIQRIIKK